MLPAVPVHGSNLTCFTSAVAVYLSHYGIDYTFAFGLQLYLALKLEELDELRGSFIYFHHPLTRDSPLYIFQPTRCQTDDQSIAHKQLLEEWKKQRQVIVIGDAYNLPWHISYHKKHGIHWFVIEDINEVQQKIYIHDPFELIDTHGTQLPYSGWVPLSVLADLAKVYDGALHPYLSRDLHGFGTEESFDLTDYHGYQWFAIHMAVKSQDISYSYLVQELTNTYLHMTGAVQRQDLAKKGWLMGIEAVAYLPSLFRNNLANPALYNMRDDFWGISRHRRLFIYALKKMAQETKEMYLANLANWCEETLLPLWSAIPRIMIYNASCLAHCRAPRNVLIEQAEKIYQAETECLQKLGEYLSDNKEPWLTNERLSQQVPTSSQPIIQNYAADEKSLQIQIAPINIHQVSFEELVKNIWTNILEREYIDIYDNFFEVGGDSLKATRILSFLSATFQIEIPLLTFLEKPTIAELSRLIGEFFCDEPDTPTGEKREIEGEEL